MYNLVTILVCSVSTFLFAKTPANSNTKKSIDVMNSSNVVIKIMILLYQFFYNVQLRSVSYLPQLSAAATK